MIQGLIIFAVTIVFGLMALAQFSWTLSTDPHGRTGSFTISIVGFIAAGGMISKYFMNNLKW
jgi:hypothetical protein